MVTRLPDLMHQTAEAPDAQPVDAHRVLELAKGRLRRRHTALAGGGAAAAVLSAVAIVASTTLWGAGDTPSPKVANTNAIVGPVIHLDSAIDAVEGKDYEVLTTYTDDDISDGVDDRSFSAVTPDGLVLYSESPFKPDDDTELGILDPQTGKTTQPFPARIGEGQGWGATADQKWIVWSPREGPIAFWAIERATGAATPFRIDDIIADSGVTGLGEGEWYPEGEALGPDDRLYFALESWDDDGDEHPLLSVSLSGDLDARAEGQVGHWSIAGEQLVYTKTTNQPVSTVYVRDLPSGDERSFANQSGGRCNQLGLTVAADRVALFQYCGKSEGVRDDRVQITTMDGTPVTTIQASDIRLLGGTSRFLMIQSFGYSDRADEAGVYVYDLQRDRLLRLSEDRNSSQQSNFEGYADLLSWSTPVGDQGIKLWVARFL